MNSKDFLEIIRDYPAPIALTYRRMDNISIKREARTKHSLLGDLFEVILKYLSCISIIQYLRDKKYDEKINRKLQNLKRP